MISSNLIGKTLEDIKAIAKIELYLFDPEGRLLSATDKTVPADADRVSAFGASDEAMAQIGGRYFIKVSSGGELVYVLAAAGAGDETLTYAKLTAYQLQQMAAAERDGSDESDFLKNVVLDNLLQIDVIERARKYRLKYDTKRVIYLIETKTDDMDAEAALGFLSKEGAGTHIFKVDNGHIVYVRDLQPGDNDNQLLELAGTIQNALSAAGVKPVYVAYGNPAENLKELSQSYKEAGMALEVGKIFYNDAHVSAYSRLGLGRLIYQLPLTLCKRFIDEIFTDMQPDDLDEETLQTIRQFFDDSLNISEASRNLYIHRNTLVYRLDKLEKSLGLNIRNFDDALTLKIALMVDTYMNYIEHNFD